jgi:four helix bundle protein
MSSSFRDLRVWRESMTLAVATYRATAEFPKHELYGISQQMRRAAVSVPSNIAQGKGHHTDGQFCNFLFHARGSLLELQTQLLVAQELQYLSQQQAESLLDQAAMVGRSLNGLINSLRGKAARGLTMINRPTTKGQRLTTND